MTPNPMGQKLTLKMSAQNSDPPLRDDARRSGVTVDNEALKRQQDLVRAGSASQEIDVHRLSPRTRLRRGLASPGSSTPSAVEQSQAVPMGIKDDVSSHHEMSQPYLNVPMGYARHSLPGPGGLSYHESAFVPATSTSLHSDLSVDDATRSDTVPTALRRGFSFATAWARFVLGHPMRC